MKTLVFRPYDRCGHGPVSLVCGQGNAMGEDVHLSPNVVFDAYTPLTQPAIDYLSQWLAAKLPSDDVTWATNIITKALPELEWADAPGKFASTQQKRDIAAAHVLDESTAGNGLIILHLKGSHGGLVSYGRHCAILINNLGAGTLAPLSLHYLGHGGAPALNAGPAKRAKGNEPSTR